MLAPLREWNQRREDLHIARLTCIVRTGLRPIPRGFLRGMAAQEQQREQERDTRKRVLAFTRCAMSSHAWSLRRVARCLQLAYRTLADWRNRWNDLQDRLPPKPLGRFPLSATPQEQAEIDFWIRFSGPRIGVPSLEVLFPELPRREIAYLLWRTRQHIKLERNEKYPPSVLRWHRAGTVWAMDFCEPDNAIDALYPYILVVTDLATGCVLAARPCFNANAATTVAVLTELFLAYSPPLVIKSDNGPHFIAQEVAVLLDTWAVALLLSPPYTPKYNGAVEARNGSIKTYAADFARFHGRIGRWSCDDVEGARLLVNHSPALDHLLNPAEGFAFRSTIDLDLRRVFWEAIAAAFDRRRQQWLAKGQVNARLGLDGEPMRQGVLERLAIADALQELGLLTIRSEPVSQPIHGTKSA